MKNEYTGELCCDFCGRILTKDEIINGGFDKKNFTIHFCLECYERIEGIIKEGQIDFLCEDRMRETGVITNE